MKYPTSPRRLAPLFAGLSALGITPLITAANIEWNPPVVGSGGTVSWANNLNWTGGTAPANNINDDIAVFSGTTAYNFQPTLDAFTVRSINGLVFGGAGTVAATLGASTGTSTTNGAATSGATTLTFADATGLQVGQVITGAGIGVGTFITGISGNTVTLSRATTGNTATNSTITVISGLNLGDGGITLLADTPSVINTITAPITLAADQTWTNSTTNRTLAIQGSINLGNNTLTLTGAAGSIISFNGSSTTQSITGTGDIIINTAGRASFGSGSGNPQSHTFTGGITLNQGVLNISGGGSGGTGPVSALGTGVLTINGGSIRGDGNIAGRALLNSGQVWNADWTYDGNKAINMGVGGITLGTAAGTGRKLTTNGGGNVLTLGGAISNGTTATNFTKAGASVLLLTGASTYTGSTTIEAGTIRIGGADNRLPTSTTVTINGGATAADAGTLDLNGLNQSVVGLSGGAGAFTGKVTNDAAGTGTSTLTVTGTSTFDGIIQNGLTAFTALTKSTGGTLTLAGLNTYTGNTTVTDGTLHLAQTGGLTFAIGANDVNNSVTGTGSVIFEGTFNFDLTNTDATEGNSWTIVDVGTLTASFTGTFAVNGFTETANVWTLGNYSFSEATGLLTYAAIPEPSTFAVLIGAGALGLGVLRRRRTA